MRATSIFRGLLPATKHLWGQRRPLTVDVRALLRTAQCVCFDVDSTVITEEGIDMLAGFKGQGAAVAALTAQAMGGHALFQDALRDRLALITPSAADIAEMLKSHPPTLTSGIAEVVSLLQARGTHVYLVSGGFRQMINPVAEMLHIPRHRIFANNLLFNEDGSFQGFDAKELTSRDGGKPAVIRRLKDEHGYASVIMVGDGATDMQAKPPADAFIGFGGIVIRDKVRAGADWFITDFKVLILR
jgi:phosphoserine phosphatase